MSSFTDALYDLAEANSGYFTSTEAARIGVSRQLLRHHATTGTIKQVAHGIYRLVRFPAQPFEDLVVVTLWAGLDSAISYESALTVHEAGDAMPAQIHVTLPRRFRGVRDGVVIHTAPLPADDVTRRSGVTVTTIERTLIDVALRSDMSLVRSALDDALDRGLTTSRRLKTAVVAHPNAEVVSNALGVVL